MDDLLLLDPAIRNWVVLPMVLIMVLVGLTRHFVQQLLKSDKQLDAAELKNRQTLQRAQRLRSHGHYLQRDAFSMRKSYFTAKETGVLRAKVAKGANPMMNPMGMVDMMKNNMTFMLPNMVMMGVIGFFFSGFVLVKVPFPLTARFKLMLQRGVDLTTLDVSYVSSLSWYFLVMFGLRGLFKLILGEDSAVLDEAKAAQMQMGMGMGGGGGQGFDATKAFQQERVNLDMASLVRRGVDVIAPLCCVRKRDAAATRLAKRRARPCAIRERSPTRDSVALSNLAAILPRSAANLAGVPPLGRARRRTEAPRTAAHHHPRAAGAEPRCPGGCGCAGGQGRGRRFREADREEERQKVSL